MAGIWHDLIPTVILISSFPLGAHSRENCASVHELPTQSELFSNVTENLAMGIPRNFELRECGCMGMETTGSTCWLGSCESGGICSDDGGSWDATLLRGIPLFPSTGWRALVRGAKKENSRFFVAFSPSRRCGLVRLRFPEGIRVVWTDGKSEGTPEHRPAPTSTS